MTDCHPSVDPYVGLMPETPLCSSDELDDDDELLDDELLDDDDDDDDVDDDDELLDDELLDDDDECEEDDEDDDEEDDEDELDNVRSSRRPVPLSHPLPLPAALPPTAAANNMYTRKNILQTSRPLRPRARPSTRMCFSCSRQRRYARSVSSGKEGGARLILRSEICLMCCVFNGAERAAHHVLVWHLGEDCAETVRHAMRGKQVTACSKES